MAFIRDTAFDHADDLAERFLSMLTTQMPKQPDCSVAPTQARSAASATKVEAEKVGALTAPTVPRLRTYIVCDDDRPLQDSPGQTSYTH